MEGVIRLQALARTYMVRKKYGILMTTDYATTPTPRGSHGGGWLKDPVHSAKVIINSPRYPNVGGGSGMPKPRRDSVNSSSSGSTIHSTGSTPLFTYSEEHAVITIQKSFRRLSPPPCIFMIIIAVASKGKKSKSKKTETNKFRYKEKAILSRGIVNQT